MAENKIDPLTLTLGEIVDALHRDEQAMRGTTLECGCKVYVVLSDASTHKRMTDLLTKNFGGTSRWLKHH
jgi:hypothetical protein